MEKRLMKRFSKFVTVLTIGVYLLAASLAINNYATIQKENATSHKDPVEEVRNIITTIERLKENVKYPEA